VARTGEPTERQSGIEDERIRVQGILRAVRNAGFQTSMADAYIREGISLETAQTRVLEELSRLQRSNGPQYPSGGGQVFNDGGQIREVGDTMVHVRSGIENALLHRVAPETFKIDEVGRAYVGLSLMETARILLQARGIRTTGMSKMQVAGIALGLDSRGGMHTTSDFAIILADVANKTLRRMYEEAPQTFTRIARRVELPDFKPVKRNQLGEAPALLEVKENGEFTRGTIGEAKEQYQLATYGRVFALTRQALVNDDTDAFGRLTMMFGRAARNLESNLVWAQITSNPTMGDGVVLFHANHSNLAGAAAAIAIDSIGIGRAAMRNQKALDGVELLNINPRYLCVPPSLETKADQFVSTNLVASQASSVNPFAGRLEVIAEPRLEAASAIAWYLAASPDQIDMIEYGFLAGEDGPVLESRIGFDVDGLELKCRHDVAAKIIDHRGFFKNAGV
jgi:Mu-like prophage major head subunit gpT